MWIQESAGSLQDRSWPRYPQLQCERYESELAQKETLRTVQKAAAWKWRFKNKDYIGGRASSGSQEAGEEDRPAEAYGRAAFSLLTVASGSKLF